MFKGVKKTIKFRHHLKLVLSIDDWIQQHIYFTGTYEESELLFIEKNLKPDSTFIDIGANIGLFSITASAVVGDKGNIISFEPFSTNYDAFCHNININSIHNIKAERLAVADKDKIIPLYYNQDESNLGMVSSYASNHTLKEEIISTSLDTYLSDKKINTVDIIKMDIEGGEYLALLGMKSTLIKYHPLLIIEIDNNILKDTPYSDKDIYTYLKELNYTPYYINSDGNLLAERLAGDNSMNVVFRYNQN